MALLAILAGVILAVRVTAFVLPEVLQSALQSTDTTTTRDEKCSRNIAVVGSGITGAVAAYTIAEGYRSLGLPDQQPCITVLERNPIVGGRITEAYIKDDPKRPIDTCADVFSIQDQCIAAVVTGVGLLLDPEAGRRPIAGVGTWDGKGLVGFVEESGYRGPNGFSDFKQRKWSSRYEHLAVDFGINVTMARLAYDQLLAVGVLPPDPAYLPLPQRNFSQAAENFDSLIQHPLCYRDAIEFVDKTYEGRRFLNEIAFPGARERYFADDALDFNVLELYLGLDEAIEVRVQGGALRLIERLLQLSGAEIRLDTSVLKIDSSASDFEDIGPLVTSLSSASGKSLTERFDNVILATSLDRSNISFEPQLPDGPGLKQEYQDSFVTHLITESRLSPRFFNYTDTMPQNIFTTANCSQDGCQNSPDFFSLTLLQEFRSFQSPDEREKIEYLFKIISRKELSDQQIAQYFELPEPPAQPVTCTWINRQNLPGSVPLLRPKDPEKPCKNFLEDFEIAPRVWYAGGGEQVVAAAEFGCRLGANAAALVLDEMLDVKEDNV